MEKIVVFAVLGGAARQFAVVARLAAAGIRVCVYGLPERPLGDGVTFCGDWREAVAPSRVILLPLPASPDGMRVNLPLAPDEAPILLSDLFATAPKDALIAGGRFSPGIKARAEAAGRELYDFAGSETFARQNAVPTAEGAVAILMERIPRTVRGLSVAVTGYGRVAKALCRLLLAMGADVTVGARKRAALEEAALAGCRTQPLCGADSVRKLTKGKSAVFNTVPYWLFTKEVLSSLDRDLLIIDLASSPGGVDVEAAGAYGLSVVWALSLPGKYAPETAGEIIADAVLAEWTGGARQ